MEIILKEDIIGLGFKNEIVSVKAGYGRNYLIPYGKAVIASESAKKQLAEDLKQKAVKLAKIKAEAEAMAEKLNAVQLTIPAKVSATGQIYGSVNNLHIAEELAKIKAEAEALAEKLNAVQLTISTKVSATGQIYGSVNNLHIAEELAKLGLVVNRKTIVLKDVKEVGSYVALVKLHKDVTANVAFEVVAEGANEEA